MKTQIKTAEEAFRSLLSTVNVVDALFLALASAWVDGLKTEQGPYGTSLVIGCLFDMDDVVADALYRLIDARMTKEDLSYWQGSGPGFACLQDASDRVWGRG